MNVWIVTWGGSCCDNEIDSVWISEEGAELRQSQILQGEQVPHGFMPGKHWVDAERFEVAK